VAVPLVVGCVRCALLAIGELRVVALRRRWWRRARRARARDAREILELCDALGVGPGRRVFDQVGGALARGGGLVLACRGLDADAALVVGVRLLARLVVARRTVELRERVTRADELLRARLVVERARFTSIGLTVAGTGIGEQPCAPTTFGVTFGAA